MPDKMKPPADAGQLPDEPVIREARARKRALEEELAHFHERARLSPGTWIDHEAAGKALGAALELGSVSHELRLLQLQHMMRRRGRVRDQGSEDESGRLGGDCKTPIQSRSPRPTMHEAIEPPQSPHGSQTVRRVDSEQSDRLYRLLSRLAKVQPSSARQIENAWERVRAQMPGGALERWEQRTVDGLERFLGPLG